MPISSSIICSSTSSMFPDSLNPYPSIPLNNPFVSYDVADSLFSSPSSYSPWFDCSHN